VNPGSSEGLSIRDLAGIVVRPAGFQGRLLRDSREPDRQRRCLLDATAVRRLFGCTATASLKEGWRATIRWHTDSKRPVYIK
jgi:nucleoside-diphosphate-sugar epimerase